MKTNWQHPARRIGHAILGHPQSRFEFTEPGQRAGVVCPCGLAGSGYRGFEEKDRVRFGRRSVFDPRR